MQITNEAVFIIGQDTVHLQWDVEGLAHPPHAYETEVRQAYAEGGPWQVVARGLVDAYHYQHDLPRRGRWATPFYQVTLIERATGATTTSEVLWPRHPPDMRAVGLSRRLARYLRGEYGVAAFFLKARIEGEVDEETFDSVLARPTGRRGASHGTKYKGGFYDPIPLWAKIDIDDWVLQALALHDLAESQSTCWVASTPLLSPGDMIVERHTNKRWRVGRQVERYDRRQTLFRQACLLDLIPYNDPEYDIAIVEQEA